MGALYGLDLTGYEIFRSPPNVRFWLQRILEGVSVYDERKVAAAWHGHGFDWGDRRPRLYIRDQHFLGADLCDAAVLAERVAEMNKVRESIDAILRNNGIQTVRLVQDLAAATYQYFSFDSDPKPEIAPGWSACAEYSDVRVKVRTEVAPGYMVSRGDIFECPYIAPEKNYSLADPGSWASATEWQDAMRILDDVYMGQDQAQNVRTMMDAMRGNQFMHAHGWVYGDAKPGNIGILHYGEPNQQGLLIDSESALPLGHPQFGLYTQEFSERWIHKIPGGHWGKDLFSWGFTLLKVLAKISPEFSVWQPVTAGNLTWRSYPSMPSIKNRVDKLLNDAGASRFQSIIHSMMAQDPDARPSLDVVLNELEKHI